MELITGKRPVEPEFGENKDIVYWIYNKLKSIENLVEVVDLNISEALKEDAIKVLRIAVHCTVKLLDIIVHKKGESSPTGEWNNISKLI